MRIGLLSDTHLPALIRNLDEMGPQPADFFSTVDLIMHGGDLTSTIILDWLEQFAPVVCSTGNNDPITDSRMKDVQVFEAEGWRIGMVHDLRPRAATPAELSAKHFDGAELDLMIAGDTHVDRLEREDGVVQLNSGSPNLPHHKETRWGTVALLELEPDVMRAEIVLLGHSEGATNPGVARSLEVTR